MLVRRYGHLARAYALSQAARLRACGDAEGCAIWTVVADAVARDVTLPLDHDAAE